MHVDPGSSSPKNTSFTLEAIRAGFLKGRGYTPLVKAAMENKEIYYNKDSDKWSIDGKEINTQPRQGQKLIHFERWIHKFKLAVNSEYREQFHEATQKIANSYGQTLHPTSSSRPSEFEELSQKLESKETQVQSLEQKSNQLQRQIEEKEKEKKPDLSERIQDVKIYIADTNREINIMERQLKLTELLGKYVKAHDEESPLDVASRWFSKLVDEKSAGHEKQESLLQELSEYLHPEIINKIKEDPSGTKTLLKTYEGQKELVESNLAAKKISLRSREEILSKIAQENTAIQKHNAVIDDTLAPLEARLREVEAQIGKAKAEIKEHKGEKELEEPATKTIGEAATEPKKQIETVKQPTVEEPAVSRYEVDPQHENIMRNLRDEEYNLYKSLTDNEQKLFETICNPMHAKEAHFSVVADLVLLLTKGNLKSYDFDEQTNTLTVQTNREQSGAKKMGFVTLASIEVPTEMQFKFTNGNWEIIKGPKITPVTLNSINYNEEGKVKIDITGSSLIPETMKTFRDSAVVIKNIFKIPEQIKLQ